MTKGKSGRGARKGNDKGKVKSANAMVEAAVVGRCEMLIAGPRLGEVRRVDENGEEERVSLKVGCGSSGWSCLNDEIRML